jgi:hypothetical protein
MIGRRAWPILAASWRNGPGGDAAASEHPAGGMRWNSPGVHAPSQETVEKALATAARRVERSCWLDQQRHEARFRAPRGSQLVVDDSRAVSGSRCGVRPSYAIPCLPPCFRSYPSPHRSRRMGASRLSQVTTSLAQSRFPEAWLRPLVFRASTFLTSLFGDRARWQPQITGVAHSASD